MRIVFLAGIAAAGLMMAGSASAGAFTNGSFELPGGEVREGITNGLIAGWSYDNNGGTAFDVYESDDQGDGLTAADGTHYVSFGHSGAYGGSISQTFDTTPGQLYSISYAVAEQQGDDASQDLMLTIDNAGDLTSQHNTGLGLTFSYNGLSFFATGTDATITFTDNTAPGGGGGSNLALDDVTVNGFGGNGAGGVPEPATWAMMLAGFGGLGAVMRKARRTKGAVVA
jgi:hypothetical protein